jgi:hypothetical protein
VVVLTPQVFLSLREDVGDEENLVLQVIEGQQTRKEEQMGVGEIEIVGGAVGQALKQPHDVIREVADGAGGEGRQPAPGNRSVGTGQAAQFIKEVGGAALAPAALADFGDAVPEAELPVGADAHEAVAGDLLATLDALEQERLTAGPRQPQIGGDRGEQVGRDAQGDRDDVALFRQPLEGGKVGRNHACEALSPRNTARRMIATGARRPVQISN